MTENFQLLANLDLDDSDFEMDLNLDSKVNSDSKYLKNCNYLGCLVSSDALFKYFSENDTENVSIFYVFLFLKKKKKRESQMIVKQYKPMQFFC